MPLSNVDFKADVEQGPDGSTQVFFQPLLGCYSRAPTFQAAIRKTQSKVREYLDWLESRGESVKPAPIRVKLCERVRGDWPVNMGDSVALFDCDRKPLRSEEIERYLRWMTYSWHDFQALRRKVPRSALDCKPTPDTIRSIRRIIIHLSLVQVWYIMKLRKKGEPSFRYPKGLSLWTYAERVDRDRDTSWTTLNNLRKAVVFRLRNLSGKELERITYHRPGEWTGRKTPEAWTARKVFRRFLWHERLHMNTIRKLLAQFQER